jgi:hypothetical protein
MVTSVISLLILGVLASCIYAWLLSCADCVSKGANNIDYFRGRTESEECMVLRMQRTISFREVRKTHKVPQ